MLLGEETGQQPAPKVELLPNEGNETRFYLSDVTLPQNESTKIPVIVQKVPMDRITSATKVGDDVLIGKSDKLSALIVQATQLRNLPLEEKLRRIMTLTRSAFKYYGGNTRKELETTNLGEFQWLERNVTAYSHYKATLADAVDHGYGICGHFTALSTLLTQQAGLDIVINKGDGGHVPVNILRPDNQLPLFKYVPIGQKVGPHVWYEILAADRCIPVDPTVNLIGITEQDLAMFRNAHYEDVMLAYSQTSKKPSEPGIFGELMSIIPSGMSKSTGNIYIWNHGDTLFHGNLKLTMQLTQNIQATRGGVRITGLSK